jgi:hypothetical protein
MMRKIIERGAKNEETEKTREAIRKAERNRRREEKASKAASRVTSVVPTHQPSLANTPGSTTPTNSSTFRPTPSIQSQAGSIDARVEQGSALKIMNGSQGPAPEAS